MPFAIAPSTDLLPVTASPVGLNTGMAGEDRWNPLSQTPSNGSLRVLLVEDEEHVRNVARRVLDHSGFTVVCAADGSDALTQIRENDGGFDVVLSDILMPGMDGIELAVRTRCEYPTLRFVFMTGFSDISHDKERAHGLCEAILSKPFDLNELVTTLVDAATAAK